MTLDNIAALSSSPKGFVGGPFLWELQSEGRPHRLIPGFADTDTRLYLIFLLDIFVSDTADNRSLPVGTELGRQSGSGTRFLPWQC
ncbi:hypothetical protein AVEN_251056-1 [Araneus ventricosus]|uniref:Uncharacterized protein n=1 Tax=Araneus ventricosus TaxID=182803 RepID=A0A4Y2DNE0_ARAVE|nr:hypothetical protein AVEN_251056-1 [Araneus ventricosus]